jgi:hypothetical protein
MNDVTSFLSYMVVHAGAVLSVLAGTAGSYIMEKPG